MSAYVYRCYDVDGDLIYIGCTSNVKKRIATHLRGGKAASRWLAVSMVRHEVEGPFADRAAALAAESAAISAERPVFNLQHGGELWSAYKAVVGSYLVERGHVQLALDTTCGCWRETREAGEFDPWCSVHVALSQENAA